MIREPCLQFLEHYKLELARRRFGPNATASVNLNRAASTAAADEPPPAKKPRVDLDRHYSGAQPSLALSHLDKLWRKSCHTRHSMVLDSAMPASVLVLVAQ